MDFIESQEPNPQQKVAGAGGAQVAEMIPAQPQQPMGPAQGTGLASVEQDPANMPEEEASKEENAQYEDLFLRAMASIHDVRTPPKGRRSLADQIVQSLATKAAEPQEAIGKTAASVLSNLVTMAKRQEIEYAPDVVKEVGMDIVSELYMLAGKSGAIKNLPPEDSEEAEPIIHHAVIEATKAYGEGLLATGQVDQQAQMKELQHQMQREADAGELDDWGMEEFDEESRGQLALKMGDITNG